MDKVLNVAVFGYGFMGRKHASAIQKNPGLKLTAVIDNQISSGNPEDILIFEDPESFVKAGTATELVVITTPNFLHFENAKFLLENGYHILLEKPFTLKADELEILQKKASDNGKKIYYSVINRFSPVSKFAKNLVESGKLGSLIFVQANCFWNRGENYYIKGSWKGSKDRDGGTLYTQFFHFLDMIFWLFGVPRLDYSSTGTLKNKHLIEIEDCGSINFSYESSALGNLNFSTAVNHKNFESTLIIIADNGTLKIGGQYCDRIEYLDLNGENPPKLETDATANIGLFWEEIRTAVINNQNQIDADHFVALTAFIESCYRK